MPGFDTASTIQSQVPVAINTWGQPAFWIRYFSPCYYTPLSSDGVSECRAIWQANSSAPYLGVVSTPSQSRLNGSNAEGVADAQTYISSLISAYNSVGPLLLPGNLELWCWLDQEASTSLSLSYWNGWAIYINGYSFAGGLPFYATLYCNPFAPPPNCSIVDSSSAAACWAIWSSEPLRCSNSLGNVPGWAPETCSSVPTQLWQYWDEDICASTPANVDLNTDSPSIDYPNYCFYLAASP